ncbi:MAG: N-carbamoylputrescine amidase [Gemmatimonadetes bacterium]|nr:N-carbamoylputrescine amidase [Gemmatimonadota bacterium]
MSPESSSGSGVTRRGFVALTATAAAAAAIPTPLAAALAPGSTDRRASPAPAPAFELEERTIAELQAGMQLGQYTARGLVEQYLARIEAMDRQGPALHAVIETNPDARAIADALDDERRRGRVRGPMHGIPVLVKDNIDTADRMSTTAGSLALEGSRPARDAFVVERLRAAGAVILGKTNLSEWANFRSTHSSSGWSARGGQARNPYATDRTPSGSSSGSAIAAAASYCAVAVGTETDGSVTSPAAACSLVGMKPTIGLVSRRGIIPIAHTQDTAGPMARTVTDAAILLGVLAGVDHADKATRASGVTDYTRSLDVRGLAGARIGVARKLFAGRSIATEAAFERAVAAMRGAGAVIVDHADIVTSGQFDEAEYEVLLYEFKADLESYLRGLPAGARIRTLDDLIAFNRAHAREEMPWFGQEIVESAATKGPLTSAGYRKALARSGELSRTKGIDATLAKHRLDAIVAPTQGPPALIDLVNGDPSGWSTTSPAAVAGYPAITVPMGYASGLPLGITFMGKAWSEPALLKYAYAFEQATKARVAPRYLPTATLSPSSPG